MPGLKELLAQREALQQELEQARQQEADRALREIVAKMRATWSGRGRAPQWIADKNRDDFLIQPSLFRSQ